MSSPNEETVKKNVCFLGSQIEVLIDKSDERDFDRFTWCGSSDGSESNFYIVTRIYDPETKKSSTLYLHRYLMQPPKGMLVDHINGDTSDNRRRNLRVVTRAQNNANSRKRRTSKGKPTTSKYKGVSRIPGKDRWRVQISHEGTKYHLGTYACEIVAAHAYDRKAYELFGKFAYLNLPNNRP